MVLIRKELKSKNHYINNLKKLTNLYYSVAKFLSKDNKKQKMPLITHHEVASTHLEKIDKLLINFHRLHTQI